MTDHAYRRIRALWPDHLGLARGKLLLPGAAETGHCLATFALGFDREMDAYPNSGLLDGLPDMRAVFDPAAIRPGWSEGTGVVVADLEQHGKPLERSARRILKRAIAEHEADGRDPVVGIELEAFLLKPDGEGGFQAVHTPGSHVYGSGPLMDPGGVMEAVLDAADRCGIVLESFHSEYDDGQFELTLGKNDALAAADEAFLFKLLAREVAAERGYHLTFIGKPFSDRGGSGLHVNLSLEEGGKNVFGDPDGEGGLSKLAWCAVAGLLHHHRGLAGAVAPTVNAYRRLRPGQMSGYWANWGHDHRGCAVRIPLERGAGSRIEHRLADGSCGPHLGVAATLLAARRGIQAQMTPPPEEKGDCLEASECQVTVADDLGRALDDLERDAGLAAQGRRFLLDPILEPIHFGFTESLLRYHTVRRRYPEAEIMMGIGNLTELTDADTTGITAVLMGVVSELGIGAVLTTEVSPHAHTSVREVDIARRVMWAARRDGNLPRRYHGGLMALKDRKPFPYTCAEVAQTAAAVRDPSFRIQLTREGIHVYNRDGRQLATDPFELYPGLAVDDDASHAFYLGVELGRAQIAWQLGKRYLQDNELEWGVAVRSAAEE